MFFLEAALSTDVTFHMNLHFRHLAGGIDGGIVKSIWPSEKSIQKKETSKRELGKKTISYKSEVENYL